MRKLYQTNVWGRPKPFLAIALAAITIIFGSMMVHMARTAWQGHADETIDLLGVTQELVAPPFVPQHEQVAAVGPRIVEVRLVMEEEANDFRRRWDHRPGHDF